MGRNSNEIALRRQQSLAALLSDEKAYSYHLATILSGGIFSYARLRPHFTRSAPSHLTFPGSHLTQSSIKGEFLG
jgi:hypothetical protein